MTKTAHLVRRRLLARFLQKQEGIAVLELAICLPLLLLLVVGGIEITRYILVVQKVEKAAVTVSDVVAQSPAGTVHRSDLDNIMTAAAQVMEPYTFGDNGYVIISSVTQTGAPASNNPPIVTWQYGGGGMWVQTSEIGIPGGPATLPPELVLNDTDNVITAEVFYNYQPILASNGIVPDSNIYRMTLFKPRLGALTTLSYLQVSGKWRGLL